MTLHFSLGEQFTFWSSRLLARVIFAFRIACTLADERVYNAVVQPCRPERLTDE